MPAPQADGTMAFQEFTAVFERLPVDEAEPLAKESNAAFLGRVLVGWAEVRDADGDEIEFSEAAKAQFLRHIPAVQAAVLAYWQALSGREYARKNSASSAGASPAAGRGAAPRRSARPSDGA
ncbi:MAG: hypothetical protein TEF_00230 [Rhizobiales bacterium NRL2]|nr:MAG: hypothetical protein TEF_00230 [Rhizobiales bacterium NRL2]